MSEHLEFEDRIILALLEASGEDFDRVQEELSRAAGSEATPQDREMIRQYVETLGLLPLGLEPVAPRGGVKERLMAALGGDVAEVTAQDQEAEVKPVAVAPRRLFRKRQRPDAPVRGFRYYMPHLVAACLAVALVAAGGWFRQELQEQRSVVAQLQEELHQTSRRLTELDEQRYDVVASLRGMTLLSPATVEVCPLRPVGEEPVQPQAQGSLVMVSQERRWSVRLHNLQPATAGQVYTLWFFDEKDRPFKKVNLGSGERKIELDSSMMPGKMMTAAAVTLEMSPEVEHPTGPQILYGHSREMDRL